MFIDLCPVRTAAIALLAENQEYFLIRLKRLFKKIAGVPQQLWIGDLSVAVAKARTTKEETIYEDIFQQFMAHYVFQIHTAGMRKEAS